MLKYTLENKPIFVADELVAIDMSCFGFPPSIEIGKIVGKSFEHIVDNWLIEFKRDFRPTYPFSVVAVPHTFILQRSVTNEEFQEFLNS